MDLENRSLDSKERLFDELARVGAAFSNAKRFQILGLLAQGERSVEALSSAAGIGFTSVSAHLQSLKSVGLVTTRRSGNRIFYQLAGDDVAHAFVTIRDVAIGRSPAVAAALRESFEGADHVEIEEVGREELLARSRRNVAIVDVRPYEEYIAGKKKKELSM